MPRKDAVMTHVLTGTEIIRKSWPNRNLEPRAMLDRLDQFQCLVDESVLKIMPRGEGGEVEVVFFDIDFSKRKDFLSDLDLEKEYKLRGLKPVDPYSLAEINRNDPALAHEYPNITHWKHAEYEWHYISFCCRSGVRAVSVYSVGIGYGAGWYFAGVRLLVDD